MQIHCPSCQRKIEASAINIDALVAKCDPCGAVFDITSQLDRGQGGAGLAKRRGRNARPPVPLPPAIRIISDGSESALSDPGDSAFAPSYRESARRSGMLELERKWFEPKHVFLLIFAIAWNAFMVFWYAIAISSGAAAMAVFGIFHLAVGVFVFYLAITGFVNRTRIRAGDGGLSIGHGPLPWPGGKSIPSDELRQLYCRRRESRSKNGVSVSYVLSAATRDGRSIDLLASLPEADQALYLEQAIESHLGIVDVPVGDELPR